jgi:hypothetical protein
MLETAVELPLGSVATIVVIVGVLARVYYGDVLFHPRHVVIWDTIRTIGVPILHGIVYSRFGVAIEFDTPETQYVDRIPEKSFSEEFGVPLTIQAISERFNRSRSFEVPLLAGYKTDWKNRPEEGTLVSYHGPLPFSTAPDWLRPRQLHVTFFEASNGDIIVTAHEEANSYRPDKWADHLFSLSLDEEKGVEMTKHVLDDVYTEQFGRD